MRSNQAGRAMLRRLAKATRLEDQRQAGFPSPVRLADAYLNCTKAISGASVDGKEIVPDVGS